MFGRYSDITVVNGVGSVAHCIESLAMNDDDLWKNENVLTNKFGAPIKYYVS